MSKVKTKKANLTALRTQIRAGGEDPVLKWAHEFLGKNQQPVPETLAADMAAALVEELLDQNHTDGMTWLAQCDHKVAAKAARKGLHLLRSKKVDVEIPRAKSPKSANVEIAEMDEVFGLATTYDPAGQRLVWAAETGRKGLNIWRARISARTGILDFDAGQTNRKGYRFMQDELIAKIPTVCIRDKEARWLIHDAAKRTEALGRALPIDFLRATMQFGKDPGGDHPALSIKATENASEDELLALFDLEALANWKPQGDFLNSLLLKQQVVLQSQVVLDEEQRAEQLGHNIDQAVADYFDEQNLSECKQFLWDTAHFLSINEDVENAQKIIAAAKIFDGADLSGNSFVRRFFERALPADISDGSAGPDGLDPQGPKESGLIVPG